MDKKLEARIRRLERLMKNEDIYDDYDEDASDEDMSYATGIKNQSIREMMILLDGLVKQSKLAGKYNKLNNQFYKTGACLRSLDFFIKNAGL